MLYDAPVHNGYKILTHTSQRRFAKNGFSQVGNTTLPTNPINPKSVMASAIYNKNAALQGIKGISEAGYGQRYPFKGLSYGGAGSPRSSLQYSGAGSPRSSLSYAGAGSPRSSLKYAGAGSPRTSLKDAYINDNPPPGTLRRLQGLADDTVPTDTGSTFGPVSVDTPTPVDTGTTEGPAAPPPSTFWGTVTSDAGSVFGSIFGTAVSTTASAGANAVQKAITGAVTPPAPKPTLPFASSLTGKTTVFGTAVPTMLLLGGVGVAAYFMLKK